jgi:RNA polymerase sigma factor (sigma-70 family)
VSIDSMEDFEPGYIDEFTEEIEEKETAEEKISKYIEQLPSKQKEIITLRLIDKLDLKAICEKLNKDMNYVKTTQKRAIRSLKQLIECTL